MSAGMGKSEGCFLQASKSKDASRGRLLPETETAEGGAMVEHENVCWRREDENVVDASRKEDSVYMSKQIR